MAQRISIDTNVMVRFLTKDDPDQFEKAKALICDNSIFVATTVILAWIIHKVSVVQMYGGRLAAV